MDEHNETAEMNIDIAVLTAFINIAILWIKKNMEPEDVFEFDALDLWAFENDYIHTDDLPTRCDNCGGLINLWVNDEGFRERAQK